MQNNNAIAVEVPPQMVEDENATLLEPVHKTILRDVKMVGIKLYYVLIPTGRSQKTLKDWDLWGPLIFCLLLAFLLHNAATQIFVIVWVGAAVVTMNSLLLGGKVSFFQSVCIIGYCIFPMVVAALIIMIVQWSWSNIIFRITVALGSFAWSTWASVGFLAGMVPATRKALAVYPVFLFYFVISWMVIANFS